MNDVERVAVAGLVHDLPALFAATDTTVPADVQPLLDLASPATPALTEILRQSERYAMAGSGDLITDEPLVSIFSRIRLWQTEDVEPRYHQIGALPASTESHQHLFPETSIDVTNVGKHVEEIVDQLEWLVSTVDVSRFDRIYPHLLALLQKYDWCLPAHSRDVSLFDHAKLTSAIAAALAGYHADNPSENAIRNAAEDDRFCLIVGDLSGIQDYIFDITSIGPGGVARRLRARSFYLSALSDVISHQIAFQFDMPLSTNK